MPLGGGSETEEQSISPPTRQTWLDISIDLIEVKRPTQSNQIYPGQTIRIDVLLIHDSRPQQSDTPISRQLNNLFTVVLVVDDTFDNVTTQYKQVTSMTTNYTGDDQPGANAMNPPLVVTFYWNVPDRTPQGASSWSSFQFNLFASITVDDDDKSDNFRSGSGIRVSEPEFSPFVWEEGQEDREYETPVPHRVKVGETAFIPFQLQNRGPAVDLIGVEVVSIPDGWDVSAFDPRPVYPNDFEDLQLPVQISKNPFLAKAGTPNSPLEYRVVVRAYSNFYPQGPYKEPSTHVFRFKVDFRAGVEVIPEEPQVYLKPGETSYVRFSLRNTGNGPDAFTLKEDVDDVHKRKGWKFSFHQGTSIIGGTGGLVEPDTSRDVIIAVNVPASAPRFYNVNLVLIVTSQTQSYTTESEPCVLFADIRYGARIEEFERPFKVNPGRENTIMFNFTNEGNDKDPNQKLEVSYRPKGWWVFIDQSPLKITGGLGPRTTAFLEMTVFVEETTTSSTMANLPFIIIQAKGGPYDPPHVLDEVRYYFEIPLRRKLEITTAQTDKVGFVGGQVEYMINIRNTGNWLDTYNMSVDSDWAEFDTDMSQVEIAPNETYPVKLTIDIPFDAAADTDPDTPQPHPYLKWYDGYPIRITGYSQNETEEGATLTSLKLVVHVQPFYNFEMRVDPNEPELMFSMDHDEARAVRVQIKNTGNIQDVIQLDWDDLPVEYSTWIRLQNTYVDVGFGETAYAVINIAPRAGTIKEPGNISVVLKGVSTLQTSIDKNQIPVEVNVSIEIQFYRMMFDILDPKINNELIIGVHKAPENNRRYSFQADIQNIGDIEFNPNKFEKLYIVLYDGPFEVDRANITYLKKGETKTVVFLWTAAIPGTHIFTISLEGEVPISDKGAIDKTFQVFVPRPPLDDDNDDGPETPLWSVLLPLILIVIFAAAAFVFIMKYNQIYISPIDTGYDEKGEYRPWAVKEKLRGEPEQLSQPAPAPQLPAPEKPALPAAPESRPQPSPAPVPSPSPVRTLPQPQPARAPPLQMPTPRPAGPTPVQSAQRPPAPQAAAAPRPPMPQQPGPMAPQQPPRPQMPQQPRPMAPQQLPRPPAPGKQQ
ncbi:MAG: hypothetical protein ACMUIE_03560 [Thermoplasmatota archaeon]